MHRDLQRLGRAHVQAEHDDRQGDGGAGPMPPSGPGRLAGSAASNRLNHNRLVSQVRRSSVRQELLGRFIARYDAVRSPGGKTIDAAIPDPFGVAGQGVRTSRRAPRQPATPRHAATPSTATVPEPAHDDGRLSHHASVSVACTTMPTVPNSTSSTRPTLPGRRSRSPSWSKAPVRSTPLPGAPVLASANRYLRRRPHLSRDTHRCWAQKCPRTTGTNAGNAPPPTPATSRRCPG